MLVSKLLTIYDKSTAFAVINMSHSAINAVFGKVQYTLKNLLYYTTSQIIIIRKTKQFEDSQNETKF